MVPPNGEQRLDALEKRAKLFQIIIWIQALMLIVVIAVTCLNSKVHAQGSSKALRVRTLIIEDEQGRARIVMGAPFPKISERLRTDPPTQAIVFLDENGRDRLTLGRSPDPQAGGKVLHRIAPSFGVLIHDDHGDERGSYGWLSNGRAVLTLDRPGAEAWAAVVNDRTGEATMSLNFPPQIASDTSAFELGTKGSRTFLGFRTLKGADRAVFSTSNGSSPSFRIFQDNGTSRDELLSQTLAGGR